MRALLATALCLTLLSGCTSQSEPTQSAPADLADEAPPAAPSAPDTKVQEGYDLLIGLPETTWTFDVAPGGHGFARVGLIGRVVDGVVTDGNYCLRWEWQSGASYSRGSQGACSQNGVFVTFNGVHLGHKNLLNWETLPQGAYKISLRAEPQAHIMNVAIVVDNP